MYKRIFVDANVLLDLHDPERPTNLSSQKALGFLVEDEEVELFSSCDLMTTLYYVLAKSEGKEIALSFVSEINTLCRLIPFDNDAIERVCELMALDSGFTDMEDTLQYYLARQAECDLVLSNDQAFYSPDIPLLGTESFVRKYGL